MTLGRNSFLKISIIIIIIAVVLMISINTTSAINSTITIATAILGFLIIIFQLLRDYKIKKAEFIYSLNDTFNNDEDITYIYSKLKQSRIENTEFTQEDGMRMGDYVMFFMIMNYLIEEGLVTIKMMDAIFSNKFFLFCNNKYAYKYQLSQKDINYPLLNLYVKWYNYRIKKNMTIHYIDNFNPVTQTDLFQTDKKGYISIT